MSVLIAFVTKYGAAKKCADWIAEKLGEKADVVDLAKTKPDLAKYDKVILGGSIYAGNIPNVMKNFCAQNLDALKSKKLGLYICCMAEGEIAEKHLADAYPAGLRSAAAVADYLGGAYYFEKMNFFVKWMIKKISGTGVSQEKYLADRIDRFAETMKSVCD